MAYWFGGRTLGYGDDPVFLAVAFGYIGLCLYTWVADPLTRLWTKLVPPR